jgi:hypothetical protein
MVRVQLRRAGERRAGEVQGESHRSWRMDEGRWPEDVECVSRSSSFFAYLS